MTRITGKGEISMKRLVAQLQREEGAAAVIMAFAMVIFLCLCAVTVDLGMMYTKRSALQSAVDSAVLAAAYELPNTTLATQKAVEYMQKNGFTAENISLTYLYDNSVVRASAHLQTETYFAKVINVDSMNIGLNASAKKETKNLDPVMDYLIFSGSNTATLNLGGTLRIYGSIHSNGSLYVSPSNGYIQGNAESNRNFYINSYTTTVGGSQILRAPILAMPNFTDETAQVFPNYYETVLSAADLNKISTKQYFSGNTKIVGNCKISNQAVISGNLYVEGNLTIDGGEPVCVLNGNIYSTGSITFNNTFKGNGCVFARGDITFNGGSAQFSTTTPICIYSETGNISLVTGNSEVHGMVYAPMGTINVQGGTTTFYGSIIGNRIVGMPNNLIMHSLDMDLPFETSKTYTRLVE